MSVFGTYEWAISNANFINGCSHDCKYCYSKEMAIRFKRKTPATWSKEVVNKSSLNRTFHKPNKDGYIMFPSSHDVTPLHLDESLKFLRNMLAAGNKVLIVTKPHLSVIREICKEFKDYKEKILFRFTIGSVNSDILKFWEPNAPDYQERKQSVIYAYRHGFMTSLSCEPMLDANIDEVVNDLQKFVTDSIWIGKANFLIRRLTANHSTDKETIRKAHELIDLQSDDNIKKLYKRLSKNKKIKWKESVKKVVGLNISESKGCDV